ncbi:GSCOCG00012991001-RA-CDS, partial [Cotesia congregata]
KTILIFSHILSLAAKELRNSSDFIVTPRRANEIPTEDISLLQEMAFVRHYQEIHDHMEMTKKREEEEFNSLKAAGSLWTCQCCFDDECMPSQCSTCENTHVFCNSCVIKGTDTRLGDGETRVPCFLNCGSEFSISTLQHVLPPTKFSILLKKRQAAEVMAAGLEGLVSCPFCHFASIPAEGDKVFKCLNPECMKESCIQCKEPNHVPYKCGELDKKDKARKYIEEKMTQALTRTCYQCKRAFFKEEGCNKMLCPCGAMMCYICNQPVKGYDHFRGQGSTEMNKYVDWKFFI